MSQIQSDRRLLPRVALLWFCLAAVPPGWAQTGRSAPDGLKVGPWALAPYFETGWERDDNVFRTDDNTLEPESDEINSYTLGLGADLPFRNSLLALSYEASQVRYHEHTFSLDTDEEVGADLTLNLNNKDSIVIRERYYRGFSDIGRIENAEIVFDGEGFRQNRLDFEIARGVNREKGYAIRLTHVDHAYDETSGSTISRSYFSYDGFDAAVEYRQPLPSYKWIVAYYGARRFDHFAVNSETGENQRFREERSETAQVGIRGLLGRGQPIVLRVGFGRFRYEFPDGSSGSSDASDFTGLAAHLDWRLAIGGGSELSLNLDRRALPSNSDTYYVNTELGAAFSRDILRESSVDLGLRLGQNSYGDSALECGGLSRDDKNYRLQGGLDLRPHPRLSYEISGSYQVRDSNCAAFDYEATEIAIGVSMGWF